MSTAENAPARGRARLARPLATVVVFALLPFIVFLNDNRDELALDARLAAYSLLLLVPGVALVLVVAARGGLPAAERAGVLFAVGSYLFFRFELVQDLAEAIGWPSTGLQVVALWALLTGVALALALWLSRHRVVWDYTLIAGVLLLGVTLAGYVRFAVRDDPAAADVRGALPVLEGHEAQGGPNVYFFLFDGYSRSDQLRKLTGYDNRPFEDELRRRGFVVEERALAGYPMTLPSLASTLAMDYVTQPGLQEDWRPLYDVIRGESTAVASFRRLGYQFALATDYEMFACDGREDVCIEGEDGGGGVLGEREWALLDGTPLINVLPRVGIEAVEEGGAAMLDPEGVVRELQRRSLQPPWFLQAHILAPHPPYRYRRDCSVRAAAGRELDTWGDVRETGRLYAETTSCLNENVLRALDLIDDDDIVILASDHGSAFGIDTSESPRTWTDAQLQQRYGILSAARLPERCRDGEVAPRVPVNTFRIVLACITGESIPLLPERHFAADYGERPRISELSPARLGATASGRPLTAGHFTQIGAGPPG